MLKNGVFDMNRANDLARLREEMQVGQRDRVEFVADITNRVAELRKENQADNKELFIGVAELRKENQAQNTAAHAAWYGTA
ncbi:hypothetical protein [Marinobacter gelidimuriae]|uniref:hypothetical protein n=1 Tax=Marinobacter gelidimuriae TaxID=2739064 RepID=UPI00036E33FD|nr:hypothetical protein [Marinobacter gelidimuriae]